MSFKLKDTVMYKEDPQKSGILFSVENENDSFLKITGVAKIFMARMISGKTYEEIRLEVLKEYKVEEKVLDSDLLKLKEKLTQVGFIQK